MVPRLLFVFKLPPTIIARKLARVRHLSTYLLIFVLMPVLVHVSLSPLRMIKHSSILKEISLIKYSMYFTRVACSEGKIRHRVRIDYFLSVVIPQKANYSTYQVTITCMSFHRIPVLCQERKRMTKLNCQIKMIWPRPYLRP